MADEIGQVVARARAAQVGWAALPIGERIRRVEPLKSRLLDRAESIADCVHEEIGKPRVEAMLGEVLPSADLVDYWVRCIEDLLRPVPVPLDPLSYPGKRGTTYREPRGVIGAVMPWNFPIALPLRTIVPALLAGNGVVFKPSEVAPRAGAWLADLLRGLLPPDLVAVVQGGRDAGAALCSCDVDAVVFTGSVAAGRAVATACAERLVFCSLELGGKDAAIVLADADLERAAQGVVWGAMMNAGQNCASIERVYVERGVADRFTERVCALVASLRPSVDVGRLATRAQRDLVARQLADAVARGEQVLCGGQGEPSGADEREHAPTVVRVKGDDSTLMTDETFGPVLPIAVVDDVEEAVARANASRFGLTASLWTRDLERAQSLARRLRAGVVTVNNHAFTGAIPAAPWSARGDSGWGVTNSPLALDALTRPRFVLVDSSRARRDLWWYPYTPSLSHIASAMAVFRSPTRGVFARARALVALVIAMWKRTLGG